MAGQSDTQTVGWFLWLIWDLRFESHVDIKFAIWESFNQIYKVAGWFFDALALRACFNWHWRSWSRLGVFRTTHPFPSLNKSIRFLCVSLFFTKVIQQHPFASYLRRPPTLEATTHLNPLTSSWPNISENTFDNLNIEISETVVLVHWSRELNSPCNLRNTGWISFNNPHATFQTDAPSVSEPDNETVLNL